jgi:hypothetical protein
LRTVVSVHGVIYSEVKRKESYLAYGGIYDASTEEVDEEDDAEEVVVEAGGEERTEDGGKKSPEERKRFTVIVLVKRDGTLLSSLSHVVLTLTSVMSLYSSIVKAIWWGRMSGPSLGVFPRASGGPTYCRTLSFRTFILLE